MARTLNTLVFAACLVLAGAPAAHAQEVALAGVLGSKALMVVGGGAPRAVAAGESYGGVTLISVSSEGAVVEANGQRHTTFMIDTGASVVAIGQPDAERMGLDFRKGPQVGVRTANGTAQGWRVKLNSVRLGDIEIFGVEAVVTPQAMPFVLLGNSFLSDLQMTRNAQQMVLEKR